MLTWTNRHPTLTWGLAWGLSCLGIIIAGTTMVSNPLLRWTGVSLGMAAWGVAGAATFSRGRLSGMVIWAAAFLVAFLLGKSLGTSFEASGTSGLASAGFVGALIGWGTGAALGVVITSYYGGTSREIILSLLTGVAWGIIFFIGGYLGVVAGLFAALPLRSAGDIGITAGWAIGACLAGILAAKSGAIARRAIFSWE